MHGQKINKEAQKLSQSTAGSDSYLRSYSTALKKIEKQLTENQRQRYRMMAKESLEKPLLPEVQKRYVHRNDSSKLGFTDCSAQAC